MKSNIAPNVISWASVLDTVTRLQAERTARVPILAGPLALMPDAHLGKGSTIGSVIPTAGAIIPAAVGVDLGCVDADTEYLSPSGWRCMADYEGGRVMQYDPVTGAGRVLSRSAAKRAYASGELAPLAERMGAIAWQHESDLALADEHPESYKDLSQVMVDQADLVEVEHRLTTVLNYKGVS